MLFTHYCDICSYIISNYVVWHNLKLIYRVTITFYNYIAKNTVMNGNKICNSFTRICSHTSNYSAEWSLMITYNLSLLIKCFYMIQQRSIHYNVRLRLCRCILFYKLLPHLYLYCTKLWRIIRYSVVYYNVIQQLLSLRTVILHASHLPYYATV